MATKEGSYNISKEQSKSKVLKDLRGDELAKIKLLLLQRTDEVKELKLQNENIKNIIEKDKNTIERIKRKSGISPGKSKYISKNANKKQKGNNNASVKSCKLKENSNVLQLRKCIRENKEYKYNQKKIDKIVETKDLEIQTEYKKGRSYKYEFKLQRGLNEELIAKNKYLKDTEQRNKFILMNKHFIGIEEQDMFKTLNKKVIKLQKSEKTLLETIRELNVKLDLKNKTEMRKKQKESTLKKKMLRLYEINAKFLDEVDNINNALNYNRSIKKKTEKIISDLESIYKKMEDKINICKDKLRIAEEQKNELLIELKKKTEENKKINISHKMIENCQSKLQRFEHENVDLKLKLDIYMQKDKDNILLRKSYDIMQIEKRMLRKKIDRLLDNPEVLVVNNSGFSKKVQVDTIPQFLGKPCN